MDTLLKVVCLGYSFLHMPGRTLSHPQQVRTAWTENSGEVVVAWVTQLPLYGAHVEYRVSACTGKDVEAGQWQTEDAHARYVQKANKLEWQYLNLATMKGLDQGCYYQYRVGSVLSMSPYYLIPGRTPGTSSPNLSATFAVIGDMGTGFNSSSTRAHLRDLSLSRSIDAVLHVGDMAYGLNDAWKRTADRYFTEIQQFAARVPYLVVPGNHERYENFTQYISRFRMPRNDASANSNFFYSFDIGFAHIVMYNTEAYFVNEKADLVQTQFNWLVHDLQSANTRRNERPWLIVMGHKPYYCTVDWTRPFERKNWESNHDCVVRAAELRTEVEQLFYNHGVDLYIAGHVHRYERSTPIYKNETVTGERDTFGYHYNPQAPVFVLEGTGGCRKVSV